MLNGTKASLLPIYVRVSHFDAVHLMTVGSFITFRSIDLCYLCICEGESSVCLIAKIILILSEKIVKSDFFLIKNFKDVDI